MNTLKNLNLNVLLLYTIFVVSVSLVIYKNLFFLIITIVIAFILTARKNYLVLIFSTLSIVILIVPIFIKGEVSTSYIHRAKVKEVYTSSAIVRENNVDYYIFLDETVYYGDILEYECIYKQNDFSDDFNEFLRKNKVDYYCNANNVFITESKNLSSNFERKINNSQYREFSSLYSYIFFGVDSLEIESIVSKVGVIHLFTLSGFHISILFYFLFFFLKKKENINISLHIISYIVMFLFLMYVRFPISATRSFIQIISVFSISKLFSKKQNFFDSYLISLVAIILINPVLVLNIGIWISSFAVLSLKITNSIKSENKWIKYLVNMLSVYLVSNGIALYIAEYFNLLSFFYNIILTPIISFIFTIFLLFGWISFFWPFLNILSELILNFLIFLTHIPTYFAQENNYFWVTLFLTFINIFNMSYIYRKKEINYRLSIGSYLSLIIFAVYIN